MPALEKQISNNYERLCENWREKIRDMDRELLFRKLPELRMDGQYITLRHFGRKYGVNTADGVIHALEDQDPVTVDQKLNIYNLFWYSSPLAILRGQWVPFAELRGASPFAPAFQRNIINAFSQTFSGHLKELESAFQRLGGKKLAFGDVGYELNAFECIPLRFIFWDADEEFPAQANILYDYSATDFIHVESTVSIAGEGISRIAHAAELATAEALFTMNEKRNPQKNA